MKRSETPLTSESSTRDGVLYMAMELSHREWKLGFTDRRHKVRRGSIEARNLMGLPEQIGRAKARFGLAAEAAVFSGCEAGRDGFWLPCYRVSCGVHNEVLEPASIKVDRRQRRAKTNRLDVERRLMQWVRYLDGDREELQVVRVPSPGQEDQRRWHREPLRRKEERKGHRSRINARLVMQGIDLKVRSDFGKRLEELSSWDGSRPGADLKAERERE